MKVFILLGADDYRTDHILDVYASRELAEHDVAMEKHLLISRSGSGPRRTIVEKEVIGADVV